MRRPLAVLLTLAALAAATPAAAQLRPCKGVTELPGLKVLLDDIHGVEPMVLTILTQRLDSALHKWGLESQSLQPGVATSSGLRMRALRCEQRRPAGQATFTAPLVRELNNAGVVLEVWAQTQPLPPAEGRGVRAVVGYALVPVRHYEPASAYGVVMVDLKVGDASTPEQLLALLDQSGRLALYAELASGLRLLNAEAHAQARTQFCSALARLERSTDAALGDAELKTYLQTLSAQALQRAQQATPALLALEAGPCNLSPL